MNQKNLNETSNEYGIPRKLEEKVKRAYHFRKEDFLPIKGVKNYMDRCNSGLRVYNHWLYSQDKHNSKKDFEEINNKIEVEKRINKYSNKAFLGNLALIAYNTLLFGGVGFATITTIEQLLKK